MELMNGVVLIKEILSLSATAWLVLNDIRSIAVVMSFGGNAIFISGRYNFSKRKVKVGVIITVIGWTILLFFFSVKNFIMPVAELLGFTESTGKYEVIVTDEVDMGEFQERYEILDYENGVYTIKLKENSYERSYIY